MQQETSKSYAATRRQFLRTALFSCITAASRPSSAHTATVARSDLDFIALLADTLIPRTSTPGSTDVNAHLFVTGFVNQEKNPLFSRKFYEGLQQLRLDIQRKYGKNFHELPIESREIYLKQILSEKRRTEKHWFLSRFKKILLVGWALSESTAQAAFSYHGGLYQYLPSTHSSQIIMGDYIDKEYLSL